MAVTSDVNARLEFSGDAVQNEVFRWAQNIVSPGQSEVQDLSNGANTISIPTGGASVIAGVIIVPPSANAVVMTLKGISGDTGIILGLTNPSVISLGTTVTSFVINAGSAITGVRFFFF